MKGQQGGADGSDPPRPQSVNDQLPIADRPGDAEKAAKRCEHDRLAEQESPNGRHPEAGRTEDPDLFQALLDTQLEEQHRQHQCRDDEEETEVGEILAEVGRPPCRGECCIADWVQHHAHRLR